MLSASPSSPASGAGAASTSSHPGIQHISSKDLAPTLRPVFTRQESINILSYYQSPLADQGLSYAPPDDSEAPVRPPLHQRTLSGGSSSSSDYSAASDTAARPADSPTSSRTRSSLPSDGGGDRRRVAIVELDQPQDHRKTRSPGHEPDDVLSHSPSLRSRRGFHTDLHGLALVAPPDASPRAYSMQAPPTTAPPTGSTHHHHHQPHHTRSASEVSPSGRPPKPKRAVGIVGTSEHERVARPQDPSSHRRTLQPPVMQFPQSRSPSPGGASDASESAHRRQESPTRFKMPPPFVRTTTGQSVLLTPEIGQSKEVTTRVAAPVVYDLASPTHDRSYSPASSHSSSPRIVVDSPPARNYTDTTSYLTYQPGLHATAGPLPPPPRAAFSIDPTTPPPPRPPRLHSPTVADTSADMEAVRKALTLPANVSAALSSRVLRTPGSEARTRNTEPSSDVDSVGSSSFGSNLVSRRSVHWREGAFPPSINTTSTSSSEYSATTSPKDVTISRNTSHLSHQASETLTDQNIGPSIARDASPAVTPLHRTESSTEIRVEGPEGNTEWIDVDNEYRDEGGHDMMTRKSSLGHSSRGSHSPARTESNLDPSEGLPSPPPKSFRTSFATNMKRFSSLPRTPTSPPAPDPRRLRHHPGGLSVERPPSPPISIPLPRPPRSHRRKKDPYPAALFCAEVHAERNTVERCLIYIEKINELYNYDCGLSDWVAQTKFKSTVERSKPYLRGVASPPTAQQPRHPSRGSEVSEVTFPVRYDSTTATDLTSRSGDTLAPTSPPPELPYPSLAHSPTKSPMPLRSSPLTNTPPTSLRSLVAPHKPGFFASLGRKTSVKRERPQISSPMGSLATPKVLTKSPPAVPRPPIMIPSTSVPNMPGGPRAPPDRRLSRRSQTAFAGMQRFSAQPGAGASGAMSDSGHGHTSHAHMSLLRRPSLSAVQPPMQSSKVPSTPASGSTPGKAKPAEDPEFARQVGKLADLLPDANRDILAAYLRRTGQDMLAIGQYLEDEKNGRLRGD